VELKRGPRGAVVRITLDKDGGIGHADLQAAAEEVSAILDVEEPIGGSYTLETSSPGLDRPLRNAADYRRSIGRLARLSSAEPIGGRRHWSGRLAGVDEQAGIVTLCLEKEGGNLVELPLDSLAQARLEVEFKRS
jgi:ribosome maturation factor RimP